MLSAMTHVLPNADVSQDADDTQRDPLEHEPAALTLINAGNVMWWLQMLTVLDSSVRQQAQLQRQPAMID
jgi:hypothetical protein